MPIQKIQKVSITHDAIIDTLVARPDLSQKALAGIFGYTQTGMGIIVRSDAFKARLEQRKAELVDPLVMQTVEDRLRGLATASIEILERKLETSEDPKLALATLEASTKAGLFGARNNVTINQTAFVVPLPGPAESSAEWAAKFAPRAVRAPVEVVEAQISEVPPATL